MPAGIQSLVPPRKPDWSRPDDWKVNGISFSLFSFLTLLTFTVYLTIRYYRYALLFGYSSKTFLAPTGSVEYWSSVTVQRTM